MKKALTQFIPHSITRFLKKHIHYPYTLRNFKKQRWPAIFLIEKLVPPGNIIVDAGANIGYVSMLLARMTGPSGRVYSFEPVPETHSYLSHNMQALRISNVNTYNLGLSNQAAELHMTIPKAEHGLPNFYEARITDQSTGEQLRNINVIPLDQISEINQHPIAFIKIDVEGHEWPMIQGAKRVIETHHPILFIEIDDDLDDPSGNSGQLYTYLTEQGYKAYIQHDRQLALRQPGQSAVDYFFIHRSTVIPAGMMRP